MDARTIGYGDAAARQLSINVLNGFIPLSVDDFKKCDANGDVGDTTANGGVLSSNTTPILRGNAAETQEISWATGVVDAVRAQITLPPDFDGTADSVIELWVNSGTTDAANFGVETGWDGAALVLDTVDDAATKSATTHRVTVTVAASDIPDTARRLTLILTPPAHATNAFQLEGAGIQFKRKLANTTAVA